VGVVSIAGPETLEQFPDSSGRVCPWARAEVVDDNDQILPPGSSGHLRLQVEGMVDGYYQAPAHSAKRFRNGWYYPGDRARIDAERLLFIEGREDDVINFNGIKANPGDIENVLRSHPAVEDAAALVLVDASGRDLLAAAYIAATRVTTAELLAYARERLGPLSPRQLVQVAAFPRNTNGKLLRDQLLAQVGLQLKAASGPH
jgi:acyl-coenzyme A synthetase/AMP-(fatty) acid ligase